MFPISQTSVGEKVALEIGLPDELLEFEGKKVSKQSVIALAKLAGLNVTE